MTAKLSPSRFIYFSIAFLLLFLLSACTPTENNSQVAPTPSAERLFTLVQLPTPNLRTVAIQQSTATPLSTASLSAECETPHEGSRTRYDLNTLLDWNTRQVQVLQTVYYHNTSNAPLDELVFHVEPRRMTNVNVMSFQHALSADDTPIPNIVLDGWRLTVPLIDPVEAGCDAVIKLQYTLNLQPYSGAYPVGWLSYTQRQLNLGHWFPTIGLYEYKDKGEWYVPDRHYIGEQTTAEIADYSVRLQVQNAPRDLQIAAPGTITPLEGDIWEFRLTRARDFALSLSSEFRKSTETVGDIAVELYYFRNDNDRSTAPIRAMVDAKQALALYIELFGDYPYERIVVVEGDFPDGLEFTGMVFVSEAWFRTWNTQVDDWLTIITVHEIAHQWWYALVGSNQANDPYLDEALATYAELLYYERYYPTLIDWWWQFRIFTYPSKSPVDSTVYEYSSIRPYINAVYLRGVIMLQRIREEIGTPAFMQWLNDYAMLDAWGIASPADFWGALSSSDYLLTTEIRQQYLRGADILPLLTAVPNTASETISEESNQD